MWLGKIPGHSGTQFKRRQSFRLVKEFQNKELKNHPVSIKVSDSFRERNTTWVKKLKLVSLFTILLTVSGLVYLAPGAYKEINLYALNMDPYSDYGEVDFEIYTKLITKADALFENQQIHVAIRYYEKALKVCPDEVAPAIGISECSMILCIEKNIYCNRIRLLIAFD